MPYKLNVSNSIINIYRQFGIKQLQKLRKFSRKMLMAVLENLFPDVLAEGGLKAVRETQPVRRWQVFC